MAPAFTNPAPGAAASMRARVRPEVLAPAGDMECVRAAVENGADAIYFGLSRHNARARATNFSLEELPALLEFLRLRGVKAYIAFNTLVYSDELDDTAEYLEKLIACGPDALIIQDIGIMRLVRAISPTLPIHASTQATITCAEQMPALLELGVERVILARELTIKDIKAIRQATPMPLEVFVHGALCVAYSGQCLTSEALGGRSANRGACAQACRLPYEMIVDGHVHDLGERKYLLSPQDLAAFDLIPELMDAGVVSFKIEGRLKTPEYVAATTRAYRKAVDEAWAGREATWSRGEVLDLQQVFSRGFSHGFLSGIDHQVLVPALSPKKRGPALGRVTAVHDERVTVVLDNPIKTGDGISFDSGTPDDEAGGRINDIWLDRRRVTEADAGDTVELGFWSIDWTKIHEGDRVWKTSDPALDKTLRATFEKIARRVTVTAVVTGRAGEPLVVEFSDGVHQVKVASEQPLETALKRPLTEEYLRGQLGRMGTTPFELGRIEMRLEGDVILPVRHINEMRRVGMADLETARRAAPVRKLSGSALAAIRTAPETVAAGEPRVVVFCRTLDQMDAALEEGFRDIELEFEDIKKYKEAVPRARERGARITLAPPRIHRPGETGLLRLVESCNPDGILVRNIAHLGYFRGDIQRIGDFSLNIANELAAAWYLDRGLDVFTPSHDLNAGQLETLLKRTPAGRAEIVLHQHMPMFHLEHCVFAAGLSKGHDVTDCGRPCDRHKLALRDRVGKSHPVTADVGCRNTVFNAVPQSASPYAPRFLELGVRRFRVELLAQTGAESRTLIRAYRDLLAGRKNGATLWRELQASNVVGVTRGPLGQGD